MIGIEPVFIKGAIIEAVNAIGRLLLRPVLMNGDGCFGEGIGVFRLLDGAVGHQDPLGGDSLRSVPLGNVEVKHCF